MATNLLLVITVKFTNTRLCIPNIHLVRLTKFVTRLGWPINLMDINSVPLRQFMHRLNQILKRWSLNFFLEVAYCKAIIYFPCFALVAGICLGVLIGFVSMHPMRQKSKNALVIPLLPVRFFLSHLLWAGDHQMEPPSPIQALGVIPFPSRFIYETVPWGDFAQW